MAFIGNIITDPDDLNSTFTSGAGALDGHYYTDELHINAVDKTFHFKGGTNLDTNGDGATGQALYSFFKDRWQDTASITKFDFPMLSITNEQFEFIDNWIPDDGASTGSLTDLTFTAATDTITTAGSVDFTDFFKVGDLLEVTGASTTANDGVYTIEAVTATIITVVEDAITDDLGGTAVGTLTSNVVVQTSATTQSDIAFNDANPDTITNAGSIDFTSLFAKGDVIEVTGSTGGTNDGSFTIDAITATTITLVTGDTLTTQASGPSVTLTNTFRTSTSKIIRTAGWSEVLSDNTVNKRVSGVVTLGTLVENGDAPYFAQDSSFTANTNTTEYTGPVNEAVRIYSQVVGDTDVSFDGANAITSTQRLDVFEVGDVITVSGGANDAATFTITAIPNPYELTHTETNTVEAGGSATLETDLTSYFKIYVRERGKLYADSDLLDIGVTTMTYIVYRFPVSNATDLNLETTSDFQIDTGGSGIPADISPYDVIDVTYLENPDTLTGVVNITGPYQQGFGYVLGDVAYDATNSKTNVDGARWYYLDTVGTGAGNGTDMNDDETDGTLWTIWDKTGGYGERWVNDAFYAFSVIIDANNTVSAGNDKTSSPYTHASGGDKENIYDWAQYALRQTSTIDVDTTRNGNVADLLAEFVGSTLETTDGVFIDDIAPVDTNSVVFNDWAGVPRSYPLVVTVTINFNSNLSDDADSVFYAYYKNPNAPTIDGNEFGTTGALQVVRSPSGNVGSDVGNNVPDGVTGSSYQFSYAYDGDTTGGRPVSTDTDIVVVAIGLETGQYVQAEGTITDAGATVSLVAPLERNYSNPV
jgi:hypothetical protein